MARESHLKNLVGKRLHAQREKNRMMSYEERGELNRKISKDLVKKPRSISLLSPKHKALKGKTEHYKDASGKRHKMSESHKGAIDSINHSHALRVKRREDNY